MNKTVQSVLLVVAFLMISAIGAYAYVVRPTKAPTEPAEANMLQEPNPSGAFQILPERSMASFSLEENLRGEHITVLGTTQNLSGEILADRQALPEAQIGAIRINARTFVTDSEQRNNAIRRLILKTENDANEFIVFEPRTIAGLPQTAELSEVFTFEVTGDLTVSGVTKSVTFMGSAMFVSDNELSGSAQTLLHYPDFGISVPNLPFLANVDQDVTLTIDFVAAR